MKQETITIETPEKIRFDYRIAPTGARIGAYVIDISIQVGIIILIVFLVFSLSGFKRSGRMVPSRVGNDFQLLAMAFLYLIYFFLQWGYFTFFELFKNGQSPGKKAMRISVIRSNGEPPDAAVIVLRNLLRAVDGFPFFYLLGGMISFLDKKSRRLGDMVADTLVVHDIRFDLKEPAFDTVISEKSTREPAMKLVTKLNEEELYVIRRFLGDRHVLPEEKQKSIGRKLAANVKKRLNIPDQVRSDPSTPPDPQAAESGSDDIVFLERVYKEHAHAPEKSTDTE